MAGRNITAGTIPKSKYVPRQMNGPVINAYAEAQRVEGTAADIITEYLHGLSIDSAQETELENIGRLVGYPRPIAPEGFNQENLFLFSNVPMVTSQENGFSDIGGTGGFLSSTDDDPSGSKLSLASYRKVLRIIAKIKRYGVTIKNIDDIAAQFDNDYTISWESNADIKVHFTNSIGYKNVWLLTQIFYRVCTAPQVTIESGGID